MMKKNDWILIFILLFIGMLIFFSLQFFAKEGKTVLVRVGGEITATYSLDSRQELKIEGKDGGSNQLMIENGKAFLKDADCPDKICVNHAPISKSGESIICLPHKVVIEIIDKEEGTEGVDIYAQ